MKKIAPVSALILMALVSSYKFDNSAYYSEGVQKAPKNIILFIGDGMGIEEVTAARKANNNTLILDQFPYSGFSITNSSDNDITDSAAGGTAISSGEKTKNGMIGVGPDSLNLRSIMEIANVNGLSTGLISTTAITHATPASFIAHNAGRGNYEDIAKDFMMNNIDVFIGGGMNHFKFRKDGIDLTLQLEKDGYDVVYNLEDMKNSTSNKLVGLLAKVDMPRVLDGRGPMLEESTRKAIEILSRNKNGFILMVEGSFIDKGGHANDIEFSNTELIDMDKAVGIALEFAKANGRTTIVVTADHETGGLSLISKNPFAKTDSAFYSTKGHSSVMVPIFSYGPQAEKFSGIHENTFFFNEFKTLLNLKE